MQRIRRASVLVAAATALLALSACGSSTAPGATGGASGDAAPAVSQKLIDAAKAEGGLTIYGDSALQTLQTWTRQFTDEYGIPVQVLRLVQSELFQRFSQERAAGQHLADVYSTSDRVSMTSAVDNGWIQKYTPAAAGEWPAERTMPGYFYPTQNGYVMSAAYNPTALSPAELKAVRADPMKACGTPAFKSRCAVGAPQAAQQAAAFWYRNTKDGWATAQAIADNKPYINPQTQVIMQGVIAGEYDVALGIPDSFAATTVLSGAPVEYVYPKISTGGFYNTGVVADAPHPNAAKLFLEWATTAKTDQAYSTITQTIPVNTKAEDDRQLTKTDWYKNPDLDTVWFDWITDTTFLSASSPNGDYLREWSRRFGYSG